MVESKIPASGEKALSMVNKIAPPVAGALAFFADPIQHGLQWGWESMLTNFMATRILNWRFRNPIELFRHAAKFPVYSDNIIGGGIAAVGIPIVQSLLKDLGIPLPETVHKILNVFKRTGAGAFAGGCAAAMTWLPGDTAKWGGTSVTLPTGAGATATGNVWMGDY